jgi:hypothetical protein
MKFTLLTRLKMALSQSKFASAVASETDFLFERARQLFRATDPNERRNRPILK